MGHLRKVGAVLTLALGCGPAASASDFAVAGRVDVIASLEVTESTPLDFGRVSDTDGTVTLSPVGTISSDPGGIHSGGTVASGQYAVKGAPDTTVGVVMSGSTTNGLTIDNFTTTEADLASVPLGPEGRFLLTIGADLTVSATDAGGGTDQPISFTISLAYN